MTTIAIVLLIMAAVAFWLMRSRAKPPTKTVLIHKSAKSPYHAVRVECSFAACEAAQTLQGKPFLSRQAPSLPLAECNHSNCKCRFSHHADRRMDDRRGPFATALEGVVLANQSDRRHRIDRRQAAI